MKSTNNGVDTIFNFSDEEFDLNEFRTHIKILNFNGKYISKQS